MAIIAEWLLSEASSGSSPGTSDDNDPATLGDADLTLDFADGGSWDSIGSGNGVNSNGATATSVHTDEFETTSKFRTALDGTTAAVLEVMGAITGQKAFYGVAQTFTQPILRITNHTTGIVRVHATLDGVEQTIFESNSSSYTDGTVAVFRVTVDTTQATEANRVLLHINGSSISGTVTCPQNDTFTFADFYAVYSGMWSFGSTIEDIEHEVYYANVQSGSSPSQSAAAVSTALFVSNDTSPYSAAPAAPAPTPQTGLAFTGGMAMGF